jgi:phosphatidylinositol-3-phosphatase
MWSKLFAWIVVIRARDTPSPRSLCLAKPWHDAPVRLRPIIASLLLPLALGACGGGDATIARPAPLPASARTDVTVIVLENRSFGQVVGNPQAPYMNRLAKVGALFTDYRAVIHPSLPNYLAILGGSTFGIDEDCTDCSANGDNLALQLSRAGVSWRAYMEGMPGVCYLGAEDGQYVKKHNPFVYFPSITSHSGRCANVVPARQLAVDARERRLPAFAWLTPDECHNAHDCSIETADRYLSRLVPGVLKLLSARGFLVLTFDEGGAGSPERGRIVTILAGPGVRRGARIAAPRDHYSLLRTLEDVFGVGYVRGARGASDLSAAFRDGSLPLF